MNDPQLQAVLDHLDTDRPGALDRLCAVLRIPSVSAQPAHDADCALTAEWFRAELAAIGFSAEIMPTAGRPVVLAHHSGPGGTPHALFYGHYDVQPPEPLELWASPPFEPAVTADRVTARGAVDDKGQVCTWLEAMRAWHAVAGGPPIAVTAVIEGEEEVTSPNLDAFLTAHRDRLRAEFAVISDTLMWDAGTPALTTRLRGISFVQVELHGPSRDLHSGIYGGSAQNPVTLLTRILGALHDQDGRVALPGFYDGIVPPSAAEVAAWENLAFSEAAFLGEVGLQEPAGERNVPGLHRLWARPTCDVNGIWGGYAGPGTKTVIAAEAGAKVSFRLAPGQDPARVADSLERWVRDRLPDGVRATVTRFGQTPGIAIATESPWIRAARDALAAEWGRPAALIGCGGSIPVVESFKRILGLDSLLMGFGLDDDRVHSPNEKFDLRSFHGGARSHARLFAALAEVRP